MTAAQCHDLVQHECSKRGKEWGATGTRLPEDERASGFWCSWNQGILVAIGPGQYMTRKTSTATGK